MKQELMAIGNIGKKQLVKRSMKWLSQFVLEHKGTLLTGSTIFFNAAGIAITYKNSPEIHDVIYTTKKKIASLDPADGNYEDLKKQIYQEGFRKLVPLVTPIILFFAGSTTAAIVNQKQNEAKIATLTAALSLAQSTISEYDLFKEEARKELGEEKFNKLQDEVTQKRVEELTVDQFDGVKVNPGDYLCCIPDFNLFFSGTKDRMILAMERANGVLRSNGRDGRSYGHGSRYGNEIVQVADILFELGDPQIEIPAIASAIEFEAGRVDEIKYRIGEGQTRGGTPYLTLEIDLENSNLKDK